MNDIERALSQISDIRTTLAATTRFRGFAPEVLVLAALASCLLAIAQYVWPEWLAANDVRFVMSWGLLMATTVITIAIEAVYRSYALHGQMAGSMLRSVVRFILPYVAVQLVTGVVLCIYAPEQVWLIPGLWQLLGFLICYSAFINLPRSIFWVSLWYLGCGTLVLLLAAQTRTLSPWMMGVPFTIGHLMLAYILRHPGETYHAP